jgi:hypothetical protein
MVSLTDSAPDPSQPVSIFEKFVPEDFLCDLYKAVIKGAETSHTFCFQNYDAAIARRLCGQYRKYEIDQLIIDLARSYSGHDHNKITATAEEIDGKCETYALIQCGPIKIVQAKVDEKGEFPRQANYRDGYARENTLFPHLADDRWGDRSMFAVLVYVPAIKGPGIVDARVGFPDRDGKKFLDSIDLMYKFPGLAKIDEQDEQDAQRVVAPVEHVAANLDIALRRAKGTGNDNRAGGA